MKNHWEKMSVNDLEAEVRRHNRLYFVLNKPEISDVDFDRLVRILEKKSPNSHILNEVGSDVNGFGKKVIHKIPLLSLDKCYDEKSINTWLSKFSGDVIASPKVDGLAVSLRYNASGKLIRAVTRGTGYEGEDITKNVKEINTVVKQIKKLIVSNYNKRFEVRGEIYMPLSIFKNYKDKNANPRNLAAGAVKQKDSTKTAEYRLSFFAYSLLGVSAESEDDKYKILENMGFKVVQDWKRVSQNKVQSVYEEFLKDRKEYDFETDGVVFIVNSTSEQMHLGSTAHHPRYAIAYKFQGDSDRTRLLKVEWSVSRTGAITPVAIVKPVQLSGAMISRATLHNLGILRKLISQGLGIGARVVMMRRGGVIPHVESVDKPGKQKIEIPKVCPSCDSKVEERDDFLYCTNAKSCVHSKIAELEHFVKAVGIDGFGRKLLEKLYESGEVTDSSEFYELKVGDLLEFERMGETLATKLLGNVEAVRRIPLDVFLLSLGIRELGKHAATILAGFGSLKNVMSKTEEELAGIDTIGPIIAHEVVSGLEERKGLIEKLLKHVRIEAAAAAGGGPLGGKSYLFTGKLLTMGRSEAQKLVESNGGVAAQSVSKDLDFLVIGDGGGAGSKLDKAKKLQEKGEKVKIITEKEFLKMIGKISREALNKGVKWSRRK